MSQNRSVPAMIAIMVPWLLAALGVAVLAGVLVKSALVSSDGSGDRATPVVPAPPAFSPLAPTASAVASSATPTVSPARTTTGRATPAQRRTDTTPSRQGRRTTPPESPRSVSRCTIVTVNGTTTSSCAGPACAVRTDDNAVSVSCRSTTSSNRRPNS